MEAEELESNVRLGGDPAMPVRHRFVPPHHRLHVERRGAEDINLCVSLPLMLRQNKLDCFHPHQLFSSWHPYT
jgi:hypothetical protein